MDGHTDVEQPVAPPTDDAKQSGSAPAPAAPEHHRRFFDVQRPKKDQPVATKEAASATPVADEPTPAAPQPAAPAPLNPEPAENLPDEMPDLAQAPPEEDAANTDESAKKPEEKKQDNAEQPQVNKPPKPPRQPGVGVAIFATIVIILGLAALATYAYLRTNNIAIF